MKLLVNGKQFSVKLIETSSQRVMFEVNDKNYLVELIDGNTTPSEKFIAKKGRIDDLQIKTGTVGENIIAAEISGLVNSIKVSIGDKINLGDTLLLLEAMKMQNRVASTCSGHITAIFVTEGQEISKGQPLIQITS